MVEGSGFEFVARPANENERELTARTTEVLVGRANQCLLQEAEMFLQAGYAAADLVVVDLDFGKRRWVMPKVELEQFLKDNRLADTCELTPKFVIEVRHVRDGK